MFKAKLGLYGTALAFAAVALLSGCAEGDGRTTSTVSPNSNTFKPVGTLQGVVTDTTTSDPIAGAVVSTGGITSTTDSRGQYILRNLPATTDALNGSVTGTYTLVIDLSRATSPINMATATTKYPEYSYRNSLTVAYTSLNDSTPCPDSNDSANPAPDNENPAGGAATGVDNVQNDGTVTNCGTNATNHDTPVDGLVATNNISIGKLDGNINGIAANCNRLSNDGTWFTNVTEALTVNLYSKALPSLANSGSGNGAALWNGRLIATTTTDATTGAYTFTGIESGLTVDLEVTNVAGTLYGTLTNVKIPGNGGTLNLSNLKVEGVLADDSPNILFACSTDTIGPVITSVSPEPGSDISVSATATTDIVIGFNEAIDQTAATGVAESGLANLYDNIEVIAVGSKTGAAVGDSVLYTLTWNTGFTQLTVAITGAGESALYYVRIKNIDTIFTDVDGNIASLGVCPDDSTTPAAYGLAVDGTVNPNTGFNNDCTVHFTTNGSETPGTPANPAVVNATSLDQASLVTAAQLDWDRTSGAKAYNVYCRLIQTWDSTTENEHPYVLVDTVTTSRASIALDGTTHADINGYVENLEIQKRYECKITGISADQVESVTASTAVSIVDAVGPLVVDNTVPVNCSAGSTAGGDVVCSGTSITGVEVKFNEYVNETTAETLANYTVTLDNATTVNPTAAVYDPDPDGNAATMDPQVVLTFTAITLASLDQGVITSGTNAAYETLIVHANDTTITVVGAGQPNVDCITFGTNGINNSPTVGDDVVGGTSISTGADGICNSTVVGDDVQVIAPGSGRVIVADTDGVIDSTPLGDDAIVEGVFMTVTGVTDVSGNTIRDAGNNISRDGNIN